MADINLTRTADDCRLYALDGGDRQLALFDGKGWGKRPVKVTIDEAGAVKPGLVVFAAFGVRGLAEDAGAAAAGASAGACAIGAKPPPAPRTAPRTRTASGPRRRGSRG
jgi:hypothetical protein